MRLLYLALNCLLLLESERKWNRMRFNFEKKVDFVVFVLAISNEKKNASGRQQNCLACSIDLCSCLFTDATEFHANSLRD